MSLVDVAENADHVPFAATESAESFAVEADGLAAQLCCKNESVVVAKEILDPVVRYWLEVAENVVPVTAPPECTNVALGLAYASHPVCVNVYEAARAGATGYKTTLAILAKIKLTTKNLLKKIFTFFLMLSFLFVLGLYV